MGWDSTKRVPLGFLNPTEGAFETLHSDGVGDSGNVMQKVFENIRRGQELNVFRGTQRYKAIVLTEPKLVNSQGSGDDDVETNHYVFRARIPEMHASIPDPTCFSEDSRDAKRFISMHPRFVSSTEVQNAEVQGTLPTTLDIVWVDFSKGAAGSRGVSGHYLAKTQEARYHAFGQCGEEGRRGSGGQGASGCGNPGECFNPDSASSAWETGTAGGIPSATAGGGQYDPTTDGNTTSGPCGELWYEDTYGIGIGSPQISNCCCGQIRYQGTDGANHLCNDEMYCHMVPYDVLDGISGEGRRVAPKGRLGCNTGPYHRYPANKSALDARFIPVWDALHAELLSLGFSRFSYTSVRRSAKHQWVLYVGDQGAQESGIYIPSPPCNGNGGRLFGHALGVACDGRWRYTSGSSGLSTGFSDASWNGLTYNEIAQKIHDEVSWPKYSIKWQGTRDVPHWEGKHLWLDVDGVTGLDPFSGGTKTSVSSLATTSLFSRICTNYYYGVYGDNPCQWHEDFYDIPFDEMASACPDANTQCLADYAVAVGADPATFHPSFNYMPDYNRAFESDTPVSSADGSSPDSTPVDSAGEPISAAESAGA